MHRPAQFHEHEQALQQRLGKKSMMDKVGKNFIRPFMPQQHCEFFAELQYVFIGVIDSQLKPWAHILYHSTSLIKVMDDRHLQINISEMPRSQLPPLKSGTDLGLLGINLSNKRRNRVTGTIVEVTQTSFSIEIKQSFGNCAKYIQPRALIPRHLSGETATGQKVTEFNVFNKSIQTLIQQADTFFVASYYFNQSILSKAELASNGADVSHRGGEPGFVHIDNSTQLTIPDYVGNNFFNTLGNIQGTGKAGLMFIDFKNSHILTMTGKASILPNPPNLARYADAKRLWQFNLEQAYFSANALPFYFNKR